MKWTIIRTGPYMEQLYSVQAPSVAEDGNFVFNTPLQSGSIPFIHLDDLGPYVHWVYSHPDESNHLDFGVATAHVSGPDVPKAFTAVTGKPAKWNDLPLEKWNELAWGGLPKKGATKIGFLAVKDETLLPLSYEQNFTNWWHLYQASGQNKGLIKRDYEFLDRIHPERVKSVEEWMRKVKYTGERKAILNTHTAKY
jgi:NmrA-like family